MKVVSLSMHQLLFELRSFARNRTAFAFTFFFPLMFLIIFGFSAGDRTESFRGGEIPFLQFFVGGILAYGIITATYTNLAMRVVNLRELGVLKRVRGTPLPPLAYMAGQVGASMVIAIVLAVATLLFSIVVYGVDVYAGSALAMIVTLVVGAFCFCALGLAISSLIPNADAAPAIVNFTMLPLVFISDIFYSVDNAPDWLATIAAFFPVKHFANAVQATFHADSSGLAFSPWDLAVMGIWGVAALGLALKKFHWESGVSN